MSLSRRTFLFGLCALFGAASMPKLRKRILDAGKPILLEPQLVSQTLYVYEGGHLSLGDHWMDRFLRQTWRQYFADIGAKTPDDLKQLAFEWDQDDLDSLIDNIHWGEIYEIHYDPMPAAYHFLRRLNIGP